MRIQGLLLPLIAGTLAASTLNAAPSAEPPVGLSVGDRFPEIVLPSLDGEPMSIRSFRGTKVAMHVWASW